MMSPKEKKNVFTRKKQKKKLVFWTVDLHSDKAQFGIFEARKKALMTKGWTPSSECAAKNGRTSPGDNFAMCAIQLPLFWQPRTEKAPTGEICRFFSLRGAQSLDLEQPIEIICHRASEDSNFDFAIRLRVRDYAVFSL